MPDLFNILNNGSRLLLESVSSSINGSNFISGRIPILIKVFIFFNLALVLLRAARSVSEVVCLRSLYQYVPVRYYYVI